MDRKIKCLSQRKPLKFLLAFITFQLNSCSLYDKVAGHGPLHNDKVQVFELYAGQTCKLQSAEKSLSVDCQELARFIDPESEGCQHSDPPQLAYFPEQSRPIQLCRGMFTEDYSQKVKLRLLVFADAGAGESTSQKYGQKEVSIAIDAICKSTSLSCDFALVAGDLIYPSGVENAFDPQLQNKFESMYSSLDPMLFFQLPGNHDYRGNVDAMVDYSYFSNQWRMPARYYAMEKLPSWLSIYGLDTTAITGDESAAITTDTQLQALESHLCSSSATWKIIFGHHPPSSHGNHGADNTAAAAVNSVWEKCRFNLYIGGHDHMQEHIHGVRYDTVVQGAAGAKIRPVSEIPGQVEAGDPSLGRERDIQRFARATHGFAIVDISATELEMFFFATSVWNYQNAAYQNPISFDDYVYSCKWSLENNVPSSQGCELQSVDDPKWEVDESSL